MLTRFLWVISLALLLVSEGQLYAITCEECKEMEKTRTRIQQELSAEEKDLANAYEKKEFQKVRDLRAKMTELRKQVLDTKAHDERCQHACRPDVVKQAQCSKIRNEIVKMEEASESEQDTAKVDALYKDLLRCNTELKQLKK